MRNALLSVLLHVGLTTVAFAQVTVGSLPRNTAEYDTGYSTRVYTYVDLAHPATADGLVTTATVLWRSSTACSNGFKLKFLRPSQSTMNYTTVAERGPFAVVADGGFTTVPLYPPVTLVRGDLIAATVSANCGGMQIGQATAIGGMVMDGDIPPTGSFNGTAERRQRTIRASSGADVLEAIVPVVGSVTGSNSSNFRTSLQISNPFGVAIQGKLVFHPAGRPASTSDPSLPYTLNRYTTTSYADVVAALHASGLGSLDIVSNSSAAPLVTARIFNDLGAAGTSGFTESAFEPALAMHGGDSFVLITPSDPANYRMNIGIRTLAAGASFDTLEFTANGIYAGSVVKTYGASFFEQVPLSTLLGHTPVPGGQIIVKVRDGEIFVYTSTTDNRTNDSAVFLPARP